MKKVVQKCYRRPPKKSEINAVYEIICKLRICSHSLAIFFSLVYYHGPFFLVSGHFDVITVLSIIAIPQQHPVKKIEQYWIKMYEKLWFIPINARNCPKWKWSFFQRVSVTFWLNCPLSLSSLKNLWFCFHSCQVESNSWWLVIYYIKRIGKIARPLALCKPSYCNQASSGQNGNEVTQ